MKLLIKLLELWDFGYPGGPKVDSLAKEGEANIKLPLTHFDGYDFSFSGIKTAVINLNHKDSNINKADLCASFEKSVTEMIIHNVEKAVKEFKADKIVLAGGVSRNSYIRNSFDEFAVTTGIKIYYPEGILCTDNAAMIASSGYYDFIKNKFADLSLNAVPNLKL